MNLNKELKDNEKELKTVKNIIAETLIISQQKYAAYQDEQRRLENEINRLKENINQPKIIKEYTKMSNLEAKIKEIWEELIVKETLKTILVKLEEDKSSNRQIIKEELTELWNISEIPIFKQILEKLITINNCVESKKPIQKENEETEKEIKAIKVMGRIKEPILMDISKSKPKLTKGVKRGIESLAELHKLGKF